MPLVSVKRKKIKDKSAIIKYKLPCLTNTTNLKLCKSLFVMTII